MSASSAVDEAVIAALNEATLIDLLPDGVWRDVARAGNTQFVVVSMPSHEDVPMLGGTAFERFTYLIKAVLRNGSAATASAAEAQIKTLIEGLSLIEGYAVAVAQRTERVAYTESDPDNPDTFWHHRGGLYEVLVSPASP